MTSEQYRRLQKQNSRKLDKLEKSRTENKFHAKSTVYNGNYYHSSGEAEYAKGLDLRLKAKDIKEWRRQVKIDLTVCGKHITNYYMDFEITHNDGHIELIEYKGAVTALFQMKWNLLHALKDELFPAGVTITMEKHRSKYNPFRMKKQ